MTRDEIVDKILIWDRANEIHLRKEDIKSLADLIEDILIQEIPLPKI